jgi:hypothetical protein
MRLRSDSFENGGRIDPQFAYGRIGAGVPMELSDNRNPHLAWSDVPDGTRSFALLCLDPDVPARFDDANRADRRIPAAAPRREFVHWVLVDVPANVRLIAAGACSQASGGRGKGAPPGPPGSAQGVNDYGPDHFGYDGPCPPWNDERLHHYVFRLHALDCASLGLRGAFTAAQAQRAMQGHVLAESGGPVLTIARPRRAPRSAPERGGSRHAPTFVS